MPTSYTESDVAESPTAVHVAAGQRRMLVRQRSQVQALPQASRGSSDAGCRQSTPPGSRPHRSSAVRRKRRAGQVGRVAGEDARDHRAHAPCRHRCCRGVAPCRREGRRRCHHRRDRRVRPRSVHRAQLVSEPAQLQPLPEERVHQRQRSHLPRHPRFPAVAGRRHHQHRCHHLHRRCARRHQRHVLRRQRRPGQSAVGASHRGMHVARHRSGATGTPASATSARPSKRTPRSTSTASSGRSSVTASASSSTPTSRCCTTTTSGPTSSCVPA